MTAIEIELTRRLELMIETAWNLNFENQCKHISVYYKHFPVKGYSSDLPQIRFIVFFKNGFSQKRKSCPDNFIEMIDCISDKMYKQVVGVRL